MKRLDKFYEEIKNKYNLIEKEKNKNSFFFIIDKNKHSKEEVKNIKEIVKKHNSKRYGILPKQKISIIQMIEGEKGYYVHAFIGNKINKSNISGGRDPNALPPKLPKSAMNFSKK